MRRAAALGATLLFAATAQAQGECQTDPQSPDLQFAVGADGRTVEFRGKSPERGLGRACVLTLDCTVRQMPTLVDYFIIPQRAGDLPAVWNIRSMRFRFADGTGQECVVTATSDPRPPLAEPPPFVRKPRRK